jgi:predicted nucleic acid-binding protein
LTELVLDASVVIKWFRDEAERHVEQARSLRAAFEAGALLVFAPPLLSLEIVNVAGRRWQWSASALAELAEALAGIGFERTDPELARVARWTALGLTAYDAAYVAVAEQTACKLITDDDTIARVAPGLAEPLGGIDGASPKKSQA